MKQDPQTKCDGEDAKSAWLSEIVSMTTVTTETSVEFDAAMMEADANGWRVLEMARGAHNAQWILKVDDEPREPSQEEFAP